MAEGGERSDIKKVLDGGLGGGGEGDTVCKITPVGFLFVG